MALAPALSSSNHARFVDACQKCTHGNKVTVKFPGGDWVFHAQWLYDARCDEGPTRNALTAFCSREDTVQVTDVSISGHSLSAHLDITWNDGTNSSFPAAWLKVMAPIVAMSPDSSAKQDEPHQLGWTTSSLTIPEIPYHELFIGKQEQEADDVTKLRVLSLLLHKSSAGIVKITGLPAPNIEEKEHKNVVTKILKFLFGEVWQHPKREPDTTFNVASHHDDQKRADDLPNYDTKQVLLPHSDHAFYDNPIQVMGFYALEGNSENTWVSSLAALETLKKEDPNLFPYLCTAPMVLGRVSRFYGDPLFQATVDTPVKLQPGSEQDVKRLRWHPNLTSSLLASYDVYKNARLAHVKLQNIIRRPSHQLKIPFLQGDLYIWDNFRLLHEREG